MRPVGSNLPSITSGRKEYNYIINGDFQVNQRRPNTASTATGSGVLGGYPIDRWEMATGTGNTSTMTVTPVDLAFGHFTGSPNGVGVSYPGIYATSRAMKIQTSTSVVGSPPCVIRTNIEDARTLSGKTCTLSGYFYTSTGSLGPYTVQVIQYFGATGSTQVVVKTATFSNTSLLNWEFFSTTFTFPSVFGKTVSSDGSRIIILVYCQYAVIADFYIANWQLEESPYYTGFHKRTFQEELYLCQRYYQKSFPYNTLPVANAGVQGAHRSNVYVSGAVAYYPPPALLSQPMMKTPTVVTYNPLVAASSEWYNQIASTSSTGTTLSAHASEREISWNATGNASWAAGQLTVIHYEAKADFDD